VAVSHSELQRETFSHIFVCSLSCANAYAFTEQQEEGFSNVVLWEQITDCSLDLEAMT